LRARRTADAIVLDRGTGCERTRGVGSPISTRGPHRRRAGGSGRGWVTARAGGGSRRRADAAFGCVGRHSKLLEGGGARGERRTWAPGSRTRKGRAGIRAQVGEYQTTAAKCTDCGPPHFHGIMFAAPAAQNGRRRLLRSPRRRPERRSPRAQKRTYSSAGVRRGVRRGSGGLHRALGSFRDAKRQRLRAGGWERKNRGRPSRMPCGSLQRGSRWRAICKR